MPRARHTLDRPREGTIVPTNMQIGRGMKLASFRSEGKTVHCRIFQERYLDAVEIIDERGNSMELPADMVDVASISKRLGMTLEIE